MTDTFKTKVERMVPDMEPAGAEWDTAYNAGRSDTLRAAEAVHDEEMAALRAELADQVAVSRRLADLHEATYAEADRLRAELDELKVKHLTEMKARGCPDGYKVVPVEDDPQLDVSGDTGGPDCECGNAPCCVAIAPCRRPPDPEPQPTHTHRWVQKLSCQICDVCSIVRTPFN